MKEYQPWESFPDTYHLTPFEGEKELIGPAAIPDPDQLSLPRATSYEAGAVVTSIYPIKPGEDSRDRTSNINMQEFLYDRLFPKVGQITIPTEVTYYDGVRRSWSISDKGPLFDPKTVLRVTAAGLLAANVIANAGALVDDAKAIGAYGKDVADRVIFELTDDGPQTVTVPGTDKIITLTLHETAKTGNTVGSSSVDPAQIDNIGFNIQLAMDPDSKIVSIDVAGQASPEWAGDASLTTEDPQNVDLALARAREVAADIANNMAGRNIETPVASVSGHEDSLTSDQAADLIHEAVAAGYPDASSAINAADGGQTLTGRLKELVTNLTSKRGSDVTVTIATPSSVPGESHTETVPGPHPPEIGPHRFGDHKLALWPLFGLLGLLPRRLRLNRFTEPVIKTGTIDRTYGDPVWIRLYKDALTETGDLKNHTAFYTRSYNHLLREPNRIQDVLRMDYYDMEGADKSLRVLFVDHKPTDATVQQFQKTLAIVANANLGQIADLISTITVYPSENAGTEHGNPRRIALGIDEQYDKSTLGVAIPILQLVELHMPVNPTDQELADFMGAINTLTHELAGHGTDIKSSPRQVIQDINGDLIGRNPWRGIMDRAHRLQGKLPGIDVTFEATIDGEKQIVLGDDKRLRWATFSRIFGFAPTRYGSTNSAEHLAETAAATVSEIPIPYIEAGQRVEEVRQTTKPHAIGYRPSKLSEDTYTDATGINPEDLDTVHTGPIKFVRTTVKNDPLLNRLARRARTTRVPKEKDMLRVLGYVINRKNR